MTTFVSYRLRGLLWMPTPDGGYFGLDWLDTIIDFIIAARRANWNVLVHCLAGVSRSSFIVAAYLMKSKHMRAQEALDHIRAKRAIINPAPIYVQALMEYETKIFGEAETVIEETV